jgi:hypothetical protein
MTDGGMPASIRPSSSRDAASSLPQSSTERLPEGQAAPDMGHVRMIGLNRRHRASAERVQRIHDNASGR